MKPEELLPPKKLDKEPLLLWAELLTPPVLESPSCLEDKVKKKLLWILMPWTNLKKPEDLGLLLSLMEEHFKILALIPGKEITPIGKPHKPLLLLDAKLIVKLLKENMLEALMDLEKNPCLLLTINIDFLTIFCLFNFINLNSIHFVFSKKWLA